MGGLLRLILLTLQFDDGIAYDFRVREQILVYHLLDRFFLVGRLKRHRRAPPRCCRWSAFQVLLIVVSFVWPP